MSVPFTPQAPRARMMVQTSWFTRSRVVVSAYPTRHINKIFWVSIHLLHTMSLGASANTDETVIHSIKSSINATNGVNGICFFSFCENTQETQVNIAMTYA